MALLTVRVLLTAIVLVLPSSVAADLAPAVEADLHILKATDYIDRKDYASAQKSIDRLLKLKDQHHLKLPADFHFHYARVLESKEQYSQAIDELHRYLDRAGKKGPYYRQALQLLHNLADPKYSPSVSSGTAYLPRANGHIFRDCSVCPLMLVVPSGDYLMGSLRKSSYDNERPVHRVKIPKPFAVGVYEVTFSEWDACVAHGGCSGYRPHDEGWGRGRKPVINVSWHDAQAYVKWLNQATGHDYRLLSESEWEYAARPGISTPIPSPLLCRYANGADATTKKRKPDSKAAACDDGHYRTAIVGAYEPNDFGLPRVIRAPA